MDTPEYTKPSRPAKVRTLGDLTIEELVKSAKSETLALGEWLDTLPMADKLVASAYIGSIAGRLIVAEMKISPS